MADNKYDDRALTEPNDKALHKPQIEIIVDGKSITLTLKEYSILYKLISARGVVFSREQLLDDIWGFDFDGDMRTVDSHVARLRTKLGKWGSDHIKTIYGTGYKVDSE